MNKAYPKITIVTPSYNQGEYLEQTILSILNQNYPNLEYIIIDGGSTDNSVEIIKKYEDQLKYWVSEKDRGQSHAINKGLEKSTGEIFNWVNSDDYLSEKSLFEIAKVFTQQTIAICGYCRTFDESSSDDDVNTQMVIQNTLEKTLVFRDVTQPSTFLNLNLVKQVGGVNESLHYVMDFELWVKILLLKGQGNIIKIDPILANFRLQDNSKSMNDYQKFRDEEYALYISVAEQTLPNSEFVQEMKIITTTQLTNQKWTISEHFKPNDYETELKRRFFPILIDKHYLEQNFSSSKKLFNEQIKTFGFKFNSIFIQNYLKLNVLPKSLVTFLKRIKNN